jgi:hypothetical protein
MEIRQIRRLPVVDPDGRCCGILSQADIARGTDTAMAAEIVRKISVPVGTPSYVI